MFIMIDNYDSFTYNLVQYFGDLGIPCDVYRNNKITVEAVLKQKPKAIIISPGPSDPDHAGICLELIQAAANHNVPLLGVCLGHQAIGQVFGGKVIRAPKPIHGKLSLIKHNNQSLFKDIPSPLSVTRYHSLIVEKSTLPAELISTAETDDGLIMGLQHRDKIIHGVQFHPESISTDHGHTMLKNFIQYTR